MTDDSIPIPDFLRTRTNRGSLTYWPPGKGPLSFEQLNRVNALLRGAHDRGVSHTRLTDREVQVLLYILRGDRNRDTARALGLSVRTVEVHRTAILAKFGARSTAHLFALLIGTIEPASPPATPCHGPGEVTPCD